MIAKKYMCPRCYKLFTEGKATEMKFKHHCHTAYDGDYLIPIDEPIADAISLMNQKGYKTKACCSGHYDEAIVSMMKETNKAFDNDELQAVPIASFYVDFEAPVEMAEFILNNPPVGLTIDVESINPRGRGIEGLSFEIHGAPVEIDPEVDYTEQDYDDNQKWIDEVYAFSFKKWVDMLVDVDDFIADLDK